MTTNELFTSNSRRLMKARDMYAIAESGEVEGEAFEKALKRFDEIIATFPEEEPLDLAQFAYHLQQLRLRQLCENITLCEGPVAEHHYMVALDLVSQARHHVKLAQYHTARELGDAALARARR